MLDQQTLARLRTALSDPDRALRAECVDALAASRDARGLCRALRSPDAYLRWRAVRTLGAFPHGAPTWRVARAAFDPVPMVREAAAAALSVRPGRFAAWTVRRLVADAAPAVRLAALRSLAQLNASAARACLVAASASDPDPWLRETAAALYRELTLRVARGGAAVGGLL